MDQNKKNILKKLTSAASTAVSPLGTAAKNLVSAVKAKYGPVHYENPTEVKLKTEIPFPKTPTSIPVSNTTSAPKWKPLTPAELNTPKVLTPEEQNAREMLRKQRNTPPSLMKK